MVQVHLRRADHLAVGHGDQGTVVGVGVHTGEVMGQGVRREEDERQSLVPDAGEALEVGTGIGAKIADGHSHGGARYGGRRCGCLSFSAGCGTIGP